MGTSCIPQDWTLFGDGLKLGKVMTVPGRICQREDMKQEMVFHSEIMGRRIVLALTIAKIERILSHMPSSFKNMANYLGNPMYIPQIRKQ